MNTIKVAPATMLCCHCTSPMTEIRSNLFFCTAEASSERELVGFDHARGKTSVDESVH
jgi:hypothetical protein